MRFRYLVYPKAKEKIKPLNLKKRLEKVRDNEDFPYLRSNLMKEDVVEIIQDMKERGYFNKFPEDQKDNFNFKTNNVFQNPGKNPWKINRRGKTLEEETMLEDLTLILGWPASYVLDKKEIWNYKKFGFDSITGFTGVVGAMVWNLLESDFRRGYRWESKDPEGRIWVNEVTGDTNADLRIYKTDITADETFDPVGNEVLYRPETNNDYHNICGYHSIETSLLVSLLKYLDQTKLDFNVIHDEMILENCQYKAGLFSRTTTEHLSPNDLNIFSAFICFNDQIPVLDKNNETKQWSSDRVGVAYGEGSSYGIYIGQNKELIFSYEKNPENPKKELSVVFQPEDAPHLIRGLFLSGVTYARKNSHISFS